MIYTYTGAAVSGPFVTENDWRQAASDNGSDAQSQKSLLSKKNGTANQLDEDNQSSCMSGDDTHESV